jgi:tripartite-type tricarboxylate transporter receptor subunit TctC
MNDRRAFTMGLATMAAMAGTMAMPAGLRAADYPSKPIRIIVAYPPGGTTDLLGRLIGHQLQTLLKQTAVVENKAGAGGGIGADAVARAAPDGYTLGLTTAGNLALNYASYDNIPYDSLKDFSFLTLIATVPNVIVVNSNVPATNLPELIGYLKKKGSGLFASTGTGNGPHLTGELFKMRTGLNLTHVPYKGSAPAITGTLGGEVDMLFDNLPAVLPFIQSGRVKAIALSSASRVPVLPDLATLQEQGMKDFVVDAWFALVAPAGLDKAAKSSLDQAIRTMAADTAVREAIQKLGANPALTGEAELRSLVQLERERWPALVKQANIKR